MAYYKKKSGSGQSVKERLEETEERIRNAVMEGLKGGTPIWQMPWIGGCGRQKSYDTGKPYRGVNAFWLSLVASVRGYTDNRWITYNQLKERKHRFEPEGAGKNQGVDIYYWFNPEKKNEKGEVVRDALGRPVLEPWLTYRKYTVFNVSLTDIPPEPKEEGKFTADEIGERMLDICPVPITYEGSRAFYRPATDSITLPPKETFLTTAGFYGTAFHEMVHSTMNKSRCDRNMGSYAAEELVAESGSVMLATILGTTFDQKEEDNATAYILNWLERATVAEFSKALQEASKASFWLYKLYRRAYEPITISVSRYGNIGPNTGLALLPVHDLVI